MKWLAAPCLLLAVTGWPARADDDKPTGDLARVQGKWKGMVGPEDSIPLVLEIKGKTVNLSITTPQGETREMKGEVRIDEKATPKKWDWVNFMRPDGQSAPDNLAIYELEGDTLRICSGGPGNARPTEMKSGEGGPPTIVKLMRVKE